jgi:hypothetical protein
MKVNAGWVLYDNFNSGVLDSELWTTNHPSYIYIEDGKLKFVLDESVDPFTYIGIRLLKDAEIIQAIKMNVTVQEMWNDARWKIDMTFGIDLDGKTLIAGQLGVKAGENKLYYDLYEGDAVTGEWPYPGILVSHIIYNDQIIGNTFNMRMDLNPNKIKFKIRDVGRNNFIPLDKEYRFYPETYNKNLGMKSNSGNGSCIVLIDNVKVLLPDE